MYGRPVRFGVLGPLEVFGVNGPLPLGGPKQRNVLAHLVLSANQVVPAGRLIDAVWGEELPEDPRATLQVYVSRLRSAIGPDAIEGRTPGYVLRDKPDEVDALRFEDLGRGAQSRLRTEGDRRGSGRSASSSGEAPPSPTSAASRRWPARSLGWKSSGSRPSRRRSARSSSSAITPTSSPSSRR